MPAHGVLILAAGGSQRMGRAKQLLPLKGITLVRRAVRAAMETQGEVVVVLGSRDKEVAAELSGLPITTVVNPRWEDGMGSSIRRGVAAFEEKGLAKSLVILPCDQPLVTTELLARLIAHHHRTGKSITAAAYGGTVGTPAVFDVQHFAELLALSDNEGGKSVMRAHPRDVSPFSMPEAGLDVDTPGEYETVLKL